MNKSDKQETGKNSFTKSENEKKGPPAMNDYSQKSTQRGFDSQNKSRRNRICSEYYCWYGHEDCYSEGGKGRYAGGRSWKSRGSTYKPWTNGHRPRGRGHRPEGGSRNSWGFGGNLNGGSVGSVQYPEWKAGFGYQQGLGQHYSQNFEGYGNQARNGYQNFQESFSAGWNFRTNIELGGCRNEVASRAHNSNSRDNNSVKQMEENIYEKVNKTGLKKNKRAKLSIEEIKKRSKKKTEGAQELAEDDEEKSEIADKAAKIKEALGSLSSSHILSPQHQIQVYQQPQSPKPDRALAVPTRVKIALVQENKSCQKNRARFVGCEEAEESATQADAFEGELPVEIADKIKQEVPDIEVISEIKQEQDFEFRPIDLIEKCEVEYGQDGDGTLDLTVMCEVGGENVHKNAGQVDIVEVPKTPSPCIDLENTACEEATTSSLIAASGSTDPIDSATRHAPVYKKRGRPYKGQARMIGGHEVVIGTVGDLVNVQENNRSEANNENHVEIILDIETSPDESIEQDNLNKIKSFGLIFEQESRLLSDLESVDSKMTSLAQERSNVVRQLLFLSELKSQMLK